MDRPGTIAGSPRPPEWAHRFVSRRAHARRLDSVVPGRAWRRLLGGCTRCCPVFVAIGTATAWMRLAPACTRKAGRAGPRKKHDEIAPLGQYGVVTMWVASRPGACRLRPLRARLHRRLPEVRSRVRLILARRGASAESRCSPRAGHMAVFCPQRSPPQPSGLSFAAFQSLPAAHTNLRRSGERQPDELRSAFAALAGRPGRAQRGLRGYSKACQAARRRSAGRRRPSASRSSRSPRRLRVPDRPRRRARPPNPPRHASAANARAGRAPARAAGPGSHPPQRDRDRSRSLRRRLAFRAAAGSSRAGRDAVRRVVKAAHGRADRGRGAQDARLVGQRQELSASTAPPVTVASACVPEPAATPGECEHRSVTGAPARRASAP